jgi:hypothetical protein
VRTRQFLEITMEKVWELRQVDAAPVPLLVDYPLGLWGVRRDKSLFPVNQACPRLSRQRSPGFLRERGTDRVKASAGMPRHYG